MENKVPGIDLSSLLVTANRQGLPTNRTKKGDLNYWSPKQDMVAGFRANSVGVELDCNWNPQTASPVIGVRKFFHK